MKQEDRRASLGQEAMKMLQMGSRRSGAAAAKGERGEGRRVKKMRTEQRVVHEISLEGPQRCPQLRGQLLQMWALQSRNQGVSRLRPSAQCPLTSRHRSPALEAITRTLSAGSAPEVPCREVSPTPMERQRPRAHSLTTGEAIRGRQVQAPGMGWGGTWG